MEEEEKRVKTEEEEEEEDRAVGGIEGWRQNHGEESKEKEVNWRTNTD